MATRSIRPPLKHTPFTELLPDGTQFVSNSWYDWALNLTKAIDTLRIIVGDPDGDGVVDDGGGVDDVNRLLAQEVTVFARDMLPTATGGCSALTVLEFGTGQPNVHALLFDPTTDESADFHVTLPFSWAGRAFKIYVYFTHGAGATTYGVTWEVTANSTSDDESIILDLPTGSIITETRTTQTAKLYITELSEAIPIARELNRDGDLVSLRIYRRPTHASDNLNIDAALIAVRFVLADTAPPALPESCVADPYVDNVILLLHGEGTDGSTTFTDSSSYNQTLTVGSGAVQIDTAQYKFGSASITNVGGGIGRIDFSVGAEGDAQEWTVEFYYRRSMTNPMFGLVLSNTNLTIKIGRTADGGTKQHKVLVQTSTYRAESVTALSLDTWHHVAVTREWNDPTPTTRIFIDGVKEAEVTTSVGPLVAAGAAWTIGIANEFDGHVDELRISTVCRYTDDFVPPTLPFCGPTAGSCITALLHFDGSNGATITLDSSLTTKTVFIVGTATLSTTWAKFGTASLAVPNTGASTQNGAKIVDHTDFDWGTGNFTITCHFRRTSNTRDGIIFTVPVTNSKHLRLWVNTSGLLRVGWQEGIFQSNNVSTGMTVALDTPTWVELVRRSGRGEVWMDGFLVYSVALASGTTEVIDCAGDIYVGCDNIAGTASLDGYIDEFVISDTARPEFEVFDSSDADWANVVFLTNGTATTDESSFAKTTSITGTTAAVSDEGGWAGRAYIQGAAASYLKATLGSDGSMTGDFTIEVLAAAGGSNVVFMAESAGYLYNNVFSGYGGTDLAMGSTNLSSGDRVHYAVSRVGSTIRGFRNGKLTGSQTYAGTVNLETLRFGMYVPNGNLHWTGQYGQIRVTKGVGRYTANFSIRPVPTVAYGPYDCASPGGATEPETVSGPSASARWYESNAYTLVSDRTPPAPTGLNCIANFTSTTDEVGIAHVSSADGTNAQVTRTGKVYLEFRTGANYGNFIGVLANTGFTAGFPTTRDPFGTAGYYCIHNIDYRGKSIGLITNGTASANSAYDWEPADVIGMAIDWDTGKVWFNKNTTWISGDPVAGTSPTFTLPSGAFTIVCGAYTFSGGIQVVDVRARSGLTLLLPPTGFSWYA